jgi:flavin-dependent dehydrogenase
MGAIKTIYLSAEAEVLLEQITKENPEFNFSGFIATSLQKYKGKTESIEDLKIAIEKVKATILIQKQELENMEERLRKEIFKKEHEEKERLQAEYKSEQSQKEQINEFTDSFLTFFDTDISEAREVAEQYARLSKEERDTIFNFGKKVGLKMKGGLKT